MSKTAIAFICLFLLAAVAAEALPKVQPAYFGGQGRPTLSQMSRISADPSGDDKTDFLDVVADYFCFSDSKFYAAIQNRGGGFPTSGKLGMEYYSYMVVLASSTDKKYVWVMNYMKVPVVGYKPGLYRIEVKNDDKLTRIGDLDVQIVKGSNLLKMSCKISTLLADPLFKAWYNSSAPSIEMLSQSFRTKVIPFGTKLVDGTSPGKELRLEK